MFFYLQEKKLVECLVSIYNKTLDRIWLESEMENADDLELPPWWWRVSVTCGVGNISFIKMQTLAMLDFCQVPLISVINLRYRFICMDLLNIIKPNHLTLVHYFNLILLYITVILLNIWSY